MFHARCSGHVASIDFDGKIIAGSLPPRALRPVAEWAAFHHDELEANWERATADRPLAGIDPLP